MNARTPHAPSFRYLSDIRVPGQLTGCVVRSEHAHARIRAIDIGPARAVPGVLAILTARDVPGRLRFGLRVQDQPVLCEDVVRTIGDPIVAIAAETPSAAARAREAVRIDLDPLPVVASAHEAIAPGAAAIHPGGNVLHATHFARGDLDAAFAACAHVVEDVYETPHQAPAFIETESALAVPEPDGSITVYAAGHWAQAERLDIAAMLAVDPARVRVVASPVGGSFGGKDQLHAQPLAALLAQATGRPVRLRYTREESFRYGVKRHPFVVRMRTGCAADGRLLAHEVDLLADTGAYAQHGPEVLDTAHENVQGPYAFEAVRATGRLVYTNIGVCGAMRGFGALQVQIALEQQIDRLARASSLDPVAFRARNLRPDTAPGQLGQTLVAPVHAGRALARLDPPQAPVRRGRFVEATGIALVEKGEGFAREGPNHARVALTLEEPGLIVASLGLSELGQGLAQATARIVARLLGLPEEQIEVRLADTETTPDSGPIAASRGIGIVYRGFALAVPRFRNAVLAVAAAQTGIGVEALRLARAGIVREDDPKGEPVVTYARLAGAIDPVLVDAPAVETTTGSGSVHASFTACAAQARIRIDIATGALAVLSVTLVPVTGPVIDAAGVRAQAEGGAALAAGLFATERLGIEGDGFDAVNFDGYLLPTRADLPEVTLVCIDDIPPDPIGPRGIGEIGVNAAAPAIANAILAATGRAVARLPPDRAALLDASEERMEPSQAENDTHDG